MAEEHSSQPSLPPLWVYLLHLGSGGVVFLTWGWFFLYKVLVYISRLPDGADKEMLQQAWWGTSVLIIVLVAYCLMLYVTFRRKLQSAYTRSAKLIKGSPISAEDIKRARNMIKQTSQLDNWCQRQDAMVLGGQHIALVLANACQEIANRIHFNIFSLQEEWKATIDVGERQLTPIMRKLTSRKEASCRIKAPSLLYELAKDIPDVENFILQSRELCDEFTQKALVMLDEKGITEKEKHRRVQEALRVLLDKAENLQKKANSITQMLKIKAGEVQQQIAQENCETISSPDLAAATP